MRFVFKAKDQDGKAKSGTIETASKELAFQILQENKLIPVSIERDAGDDQFGKYFKKTFDKASTKDLVVFFRQLQALIGSKVPVVYSLRAISDQSESKYLSSIVKDIANDIEDGSSFSQALTRYPDTFPTVVTSVIKAGEISGNLESSIKNVAISMEKNYRITAKIRGALIYPAFVLATAFVVGFASVTFIIPKLTAIVADMDAELPWHTMLVIKLGHFMENYWWAVLVVIFGVIFSVIYYIKTDAGKKEWDRIKLDLPVLGKMFQYLYIVRFAGNLVILLEGGVSIVQSLVTVSEVVNNDVYRRMILACADEVKTGGNISTVLTYSDYVPGVMSKMVTIGEKTGKISESLESVSNFYEQEMDEMVKNMSVLIEPILIVGLGIGVAILAFSILLPIYSVIQKF
ncbi:MAG: pilin biogenesis protein [Candidatus Moranbacteria bacterium GW2011_GWE1_35_17]|nr:MAG: pilin biogenesis protein [Candidatus Moranbacteria bacterium GW2011_GWE1_35_17]KKP73088.1 MAG: pilin biogenesis protein [Candidatus Moranbacteria bacterium GW2011_GWE2_35_164]KKP84840.1 MAG: pilin biogenesis protein [Candidatus Moranbacteria bacterium GW2011_GWF2_35_54]